MSEAKRLERIIINNLKNICLNSDNEEWNFHYHRSEYQLQKQNINIFFRKFRDGKPKGNFVIFCVHRTKEEAQQISDSSNVYNFTFKRKIRINLNIFSPFKIKLYLKMRGIKSYFKEKNALDEMKIAFDSLPISIIRKEKLEKIK